jgi:hypothetical protein
LGEVAINAPQAGFLGGKFHRLAVVGIAVVGRKNLSKKPCKESDFPVRYKMIPETRIFSC